MPKSIILRNNDNDLTVFDKINRLYTNLQIEDYTDDDLQSTWYDFLVFVRRHRLLNTGVHKNLSVTIAGIDNSGGEDAPPLFIQNPQLIFNEMDFSDKHVEFYAKYNDEAQFSELKKEHIIVFLKTLLYEHRDTLKEIVL